MCVSEYSKTDSCYCLILAYHSHVGVSEYVVDMRQYETFFLRLYKDTQVHLYIFLNSH